MTDRPPGDYVLCAVDVCDWALNIDGPQMQRAAIARMRRDWFSVDGLLCRTEPGVIDTFTREALVARATVIDDELRTHLETHDVVDWLKTVQRLKDELALAGRCQRPHVLPTGLTP